jgi:hypothetical protein
MIFKNNQNFFTIFLNKAIQLGLLLLLFLLPFQTRYIYHSAFVHGNFWEYGSQTIYATELLVWILIILSLVKVFLNRQKLNLSFTQNPVWTLRNLRFNGAVCAGDLAPRVCTYQGFALPMDKHGAGGPIAIGPACWCHVAPNLPVVFACRLGINAFTIGHQ